MIRSASKTPPTSASRADDSPLITGPWSPTAERLLRATMDLIEQGGEPAVKVKPLTDGLGVNVTAIYRYFGDRQGLINAAQAERYVGGITGDVHNLTNALEAATSATDFRKRLNLLTINILSPQRLPHLMRRVNIVGSAYARPDLLDLIGESSRSAMNDATVVLEVAQQRGWILRKAKIPMVVSWLNSVFFGRLLVWLDPDPPLDDDAWLMMVLEPLNQALFGRKAPTMASLTKR
jgi:AcrR family transcriptional regulator